MKTEDEERREFLMDRKQLHALVDTADEATLNLLLEILQQYQDEER
jgi:hypothetical protein